MVRKPYLDEIEALSGESTNRLIRHIHYEFDQIGKREANFDDRVRDVLRKYELEEGKVDREIRYLDSINYGCERNGKSHIEDLNTFAGQHKNSCRWNRNYRAALERVNKALKPPFPLRIQETSSPDEFLEALSKRDAHAGWSYIKTGMHYKGDYIESAREMFEQTTASIKKYGTIGKPIIIGHRLQVSGAYDDNGIRTPDKVKKKERTVNMVDVSVIQVELMFSRSLQRHWNTLSVYAGGKADEYLHRIVNSRRNRYPYWLSLDYSKFDQTIPGWLIADAFDIMKGWFNPSQMRQYEMYWNAMVNDFIHKAFVNNEGDLVFAHDGVPSGSMFTQLIDTLCNLIMLVTYEEHMLRLGVDLKLQCVICGDDNLVYSHEVIDANDCLGYIDRMFGVHGNADKCDSGTKADDPVFLSKMWKHNGCWRNGNQLIAKACYPERFRDYKNNPQLSAELIVYSYILAYPLGMREIIDVGRFERDQVQILRSYSHSDLKYVGGFLAYQQMYVG